MRNLAISIAFAWFWLLFYGVGPLDSWTEIAVGSATLVVGVVASALVGLLPAIRPLRSRRR